MPVSVSALAPAFVSANAPLILPPSVTAEVAVTVSVLDSVSAELIVSALLPEFVSVVPSCSVPPLMVVTVPFVVCVRVFAMTVPLIVTVFAPAV